MTSLEELYNKSEFSKLGKSNKDKTPLSVDDYEVSDLQKNEKQLNKARGGKLNLKKYSDSVKL